MPRINFYKHCGNRHLSKKIYWTENLENAMSCFRTEMSLLSSRSSFCSWNQCSTVWTYRPPFQGDLVLAFQKSFDKQGGRPRQWTDFMTECIVHQKQNVKPKALFTTRINTQSADVSMLQRINLVQFPEVLLSEVLCFRHQCWTQGGGWRALELVTLRIIPLISWFLMFV